MSDNTYNLLDEKWLYIETLNGETKQISLLDLVKNPDNYASLVFAFPGHNIAVLRFLISLIYAYNQPKSIDDWFDMYESNPFEPVKDFESKVRDYLNLLDKDKPFMQSIDDKYDTPVNKILMHFPASSGVNFFLHDNENIKLGVNILPSVLLSAQLFVPKMGGAGYPKALNAIPLYLYIQGGNIKQTIMLNVLYKDFVKDNISSIKLDSSVKDLLPFLEDLINAKDISLVAGINWRPRTISLNIEEGEVTCSLTGEKNDKFVENVYYKPGPKCEDYWWDSMVSRKIIQKKSGEIININTEADEFLPVWKGYSTILLGKEDKNSERKKPLVLQQYDSLCRNDDDSVLTEKILINTFGYIYKSGGKAYNGFIEDKLNYSEKIANNPEIQSAVDYAIIKTKDAANALSWSLKHLKRDSKNSSGVIFYEGEQFQFWKGLEDYFNDFINNLIQSENDKIEDIKFSWTKELIEYTWSEFNRLSNIGNSASYFKKLAEAKSKLFSKLYKDFKDYYETKNKEVSSVG